MSETRKLAAILVADIVGYSRLAGADEDRTLARLRALRSDLIDPTIAVHHGRIVKRTGDGSIIEFRSVVDAVRCAIEVQSGMVERNAGLPPDRRIDFRVGIHVGDVVEESDGDLMGDGVNIAARLEGVAKPGAICLSEDAYRQVKSRLDLKVSDLGATQLKNIVEPIRVYSLEVGQSAQAKPASSALPGDSAAPAVPKPRAGFAPLAAGIAALLVLLGASGWRLLGWLSPAPQTPALASATDKLATVPPLSIVVLPFENLSGEPEQQYFADSITDDLTTDLSHLPDSFVIARNTAFTYKGKSVDVKKIGRELGVRYVLEGSVRPIGDKITVNAQLVSTETGAHVWADRFDGERSRVGELQVAFVARLARSLDVELVRAESLRATREHANDPDAVDLAMRGWAAINQGANSINLTTARGYFEKALVIDAQLPQALLGLARALTLRANDYPGADRADKIERADIAVSPVLSEQPDNAAAHVVKSEVYFGKAQFDAAIAEANAAIADNRNLPDAHAQAGFYKIFVGHSAEAFQEIDTALRLSPRDPFRYEWDYYICHAYAHLAQWDQASEWCAKSIAANSSWWAPYVDLAAAYAWTGRDAEARAAIAGLLKTRPGFTVQDWANINWSDNPTFLRENQGIVKGLRKAGLPEQ
ncbi:MAG: guanylate cyclase [Hyphomicrobiales bacterium]|nr:guanylate cyclase [Hyphomicrobiales bacterium]